MKRGNKFEDIKIRVLDYLKNPNKYKNEANPKGQINLAFFAGFIDEKQKLELLKLLD